MRPPFPGDPMDYEEGGGPAGARKERNAPHGTLRVYLGAAPGVGKTYGMLGEGRRRAEWGTDVVIAFVEDYGRPLTRQMAQGLETVPRKTMRYREATFTETDLDAVLARHPKVALVDELAHTNIPGCRNEKRWQDIEELHGAGEVHGRRPTGGRCHVQPSEEVRARPGEEVADGSADARAGSRWWCGRGGWPRGEAAGRPVAWSSSSAEGLAGLQQSLVGHPALRLLAEDASAL